MSIGAERLAQIIGPAAVSPLSRDRPDPVSHQSRECPNGTRQGHLWFTAYRPHGCRRLGVMFDRDGRGWLLTGGIRGLAALGVGWERHG